MYAGKNKSRKQRNIATDEESLKLSSTDSRYDAGDYEAVPASIRKVREARRKEQKEQMEEANAVPASEIIAQQEAEIARLKEEMAKQSGPKSVADIYRNAVDDNEEHPTFKNPASMADFGDYEAVAASARLDAANHDPNQKVFRAKPVIKKTRNIAAPSDLSDGDYEAVAAGARHAVPPDEYVPASPDDEDYEPVMKKAPAPAPAPAEVPTEEPAEETIEKPSEEPAPSGPKEAAAEPEDEGEYEARAYTAPQEYKEPEPEEQSDEYLSDAEVMRISASSPAFSREVPEYTAPEPEPESEPAEEQEAAAPEESYSRPAPPPAPVSAVDYTVEAYTAPAPTPKPAPAPVSADDYLIKPPVQEPEPEPEAEPEYTPETAYKPEPEPVPPYTPPAPVSTPEYTSQPYTPPRQRSASGEYIHSEPYVLPSMRNAAPEENTFTRQSPSGRKIASVVDIAPGDYEAVAVSNEDDSDLDLADGSYDFDKYLANAPTLQMYEEPAVSPEEAAWADLGTEQEQPSQEDEPDITEEQTRALTEAIAQETLSNQPGTQFEDIIDNVIAKVMERKKAEDAAKAAKEEKPAEPEQKPTEPEQKPAESEQKSAEPVKVAPVREGISEPEEKPVEQPEEAPAEQPAEQKAAEPKHELEPDFIPDDTPLDDIPAVIVAELDSIDGDVSEDDIKQSVDTILISKLTAGELTLDSVQPARNKILKEVKDMQEEEAKILAELSGEKHEFKTDFLPHDIKLEDIPDAIINELDSVEGEVSDDDIKKSIDTVLIAKLALGELTLDSFESARDDIFDSLGIEQEAEKAEEAPEAEEKKEEAPAEEPVEEPEPEKKEETPTEEEQAEEPVEEEAPQTVETINTENVHYEIDTPELEPIHEAEAVPAEPEKKAEAPEESEAAEEESPAPEPEVPAEEEEKDEQTTPIPVPKEPTVLEYDPYEDKFVNPEPEEPAEEEVESVPLSAAAVLANQAQEEPEKESEPEPVEEPEQEPSEEPAPAEEPEEEPEEPAEEEPVEGPIEQPEEPAPVEEPEPAKEEPAVEPEEEPSPAEEPDGEAVGMQMTIDDIFRNPFVNDFEPLESEKTEEAEQEEQPVEEPEPVPEPEETITEPEPEPAESEQSEEAEPKAEPEAEAVPKAEAEPEAETHELESSLEPETEAIPDSELKVDEKINVDEIFALTEEEIAKAKAEEEAKAAEEAKAKTQENLEKYGVDFISEEEEQEAEDQEEYNEAKEKRHNAMQDALLMAMVDGSEKSFSDAVNKLMERDDLNARTLMSRMPIDRDELDKVLNDPEYKPDKKTALAICFALRLTWEDSVRLLYKAGHVLSDSQRFDLTVEYLLRRGVYDQNMINSVLRGSGLEGFGTPKSEI